MSRKVTTGLLGLAVEAHPREKLQALYQNILRVLSDMPPTAGYRKYTEESVKQRLDIVNTVPAWLNGAVLGENFLGVMNGPTDFDFWQRNISRTTDLTALEAKLGPGQLEEVIQQSKAELSLAKRMTHWKPWEPLVNEPPSGQWDWP